MINIRNELDPKDPETMRNLELLVKVFDKVKRRYLKIGFVCGVFASFLLALLVYVLRTLRS